MSLTVKRPTIEGMPSPAARTTSTPDGAAAPPMRLDVMRSLRKHARLAAGVGGAVFLLAFLFGLLRKPAYLSESLIYIEPLASKVLSDGTSGSYDAGRYDSYFQQQMQTALRPDILAAAIDKLPPFTWRRGGESMQSAVTRLQNSLKVQRVLTSYQLSISLVYASPEAAAAVVNAVTSSYLEQGRKDEHAVIDQRLQLLGEERQRIQQQLGEDRVEQASLGGLLGLADPSSKTASPFDAQIAGVQTQVAGAREARDVAAAQYAAVAGGSSPALTAAAEEQMATDSGLNSMKQTISQRKALLSTQMAGLTTSNPIYKQDEAEIADLDRSLDAMTQQVREKAERRLQDKLRADMQRTSDIEGRLNAELRHQTATATGAAPKLQRAQELNSDIERLTARFTVVDDAMRSLELESNGPGSAHLSVAAQVPGGPEPSKRKLILALSLPLGCFAGLFAAVFANRMDPRIYSAPDVEHVLGFSPIGVLPARSEVSGRTMEEYTLRLAAGLQSAYRTGSAQSFVFTAASATMQTSEFVQAIARILGTLGFKALVMDASAVLHAANRTQTAARGGSSYRSAALVRTIEGTRQGYAAEELERLKLKYDLLLIDAPPLLTSAETEYLVRCADATILVAESGTTVKTELYQSALLLQHLNVAGVGAVLQELHLKDAEPAFRAAIEAVERLQRGRMDRLERAPESKGGDAVERETEAESFQEPQIHETAAEFEPELRRMSALDRIKDVVDAEAVTLPAEVEPAAEAAAVAPELERLAAEPRMERVEAEPVFVTESEPFEEQDQVRSWRDLLKKTPEPVAEPEVVMTPVVPVMPKQTETSHGDDAEPVIYFQDRMRPRKAVEPVPATTEPTYVPREPETLPVERAAAYVEPVRHAVTPMVAETEPVEPVFTVHQLEPVVELSAVSPVQVRDVEPVAAEPAISLPEPVDEAVASVTPPAAVAEEAALPEAFERTVFESGNEGHWQHEAVPKQAAEYEPFEAVVEPVAEAEPAVEAAPESLMEAYLEKVDELPPGTAEAQAEEIPKTVESVMEAAAPVVHASAPAVKREPAPPKMGWFTLKFRGTTERVLRVIPGDDDDAYEPAAEDSVEPHAEPHGVASHAVSEVPAFAEAPTAEAAEETVPTAEAHEAEAYGTEQADEVHVGLKAEIDRHEPAPAAMDDVAEETSLGLEESTVEEESHSGLLSVEEPVHEQAVEAPVHAEMQEQAVDEDEDEDELELPQSEDHSGAAVTDEGHRTERVAEAFAHPVEEEEVPNLAPATESKEVSPFHDVEVDAPAETVPMHEPIAAHDVAKAAVEEHEAVEPGPIAMEMHTPVKTRWTVRDLNHEELERELAGDSAGVPVAATEAPLPPAAALMGELRSRAAAHPAMEESGERKSPSGRRSGAPVEERLEPRPASLTRRWEMLSRFDAPNAAREAEAEAPKAGS